MAYRDGLQPIIVQELTAKARINVWNAIELTFLTCQTDG
jgi:hypothetical protein